MADASKEKFDATVRLDALLIPAGPSKTAKAGSVGKIGTLPPALCLQCRGFAIASVSVQDMHLCI
jgi:hypothetical protein